MIMKHNLPFLQDSSLALPLVFLGLQVARLLVRIGADGTILMGIRFLEQKAIDNLEIRTK